MELDQLGVRVPASPLIVTLDLSLTGSIPTGLCTPVVASSELGQVSLSKGTLKGLQGRLVALLSGLLGDAQLSTDLLPGVLRLVPPQDQVVVVIRELRDSSGHVSIGGEVVARRSGLRLLSWHTIADGLRQ